LCPAQLPELCEFEAKRIKNIYIYSFKNIFMDISGSWNKPGSEERLRGYWWGREVGGPLLSFSPSPPHRLAPFRVWLDPFDFNHVDRYQDVRPTPSLACLSYRGML
jgi:hypothetical protein